MSDDYARLTMNGDDTGIHRQIIEHCLEALFWASNDKNLLLHVLVECIKINGACLHDELDRNSDLQKVRVILCE